MQGMKDHRRKTLILGSFSLAAAAFLLVILLGSQVNAGVPWDDAPAQGGALQPVVTARNEVMEAGSAATSYVFRFNPVLKSFETFTVPAGNAKPHSVDVVSNPSSVEVWFTEPGADQIGRLVYTDTDEFIFDEYALVPGSRPLNLAVDDDRGLVWFTEQAGDRIGRLEMGSGDYAGFPVAAESEPSGIDVAPDGSVWFTEVAADKVGLLTVNSPTDYDLMEFSLENGAAPAPIKVFDNDSVFVIETFDADATKEARLRQVSRVIGPATHGRLIGDASNGPYDMEIVGQDIWLTERGSGQLALFFPVTGQYPVLFTIPHLQATPTGLSVVGNDTFWFTLQTPGALARMVYTSATDVDFDFFSLPVPGLWAEDVAVDAEGNVWVVAFQAHKAYLPLIRSEGSLPLFGVQTYDHVDYDHGLNEMVDMGVHWVRVPVSWRAVEPVNVSLEQYDWSSWDRRVSGTVSEDVELILTLAGNPTWAARYPMGPVVNEADLLEFLGAAVERYDGDGKEDAPGSPVITYWEIYNEPDNANEWYADLGGYGFFGHNGAGYADLLEALYPVVKAANPNAQVVFGGVAHDSFEPNGPFDEHFIEDVLANCTGPCFDVMNYHYFPNARDHWESYGKDIIGKHNYLAAMLAHHGFDRPMMCTETTGPSAAWGGDDLQAQYVPMVYARGMAAGLVSLNWYALTDVDHTQPGLLADGGQPKPAYYAFKTLTDQLGGARFARTLTVGETGDADVEGYVFNVRVGDKFERRDVVWFDCPSFIPYPPQDCSDTAPMMIAAEAVKVVDVYGNEEVMSDGGDGVADGKVELIITSSPVYIDYTP